MHTPSARTALVAGLLFMSSTANAVETETKELSLADLMGLQNAIGTLTRMERNKVPVSVTTITEEDIRLTPARNLLDLIEALVPGAMYTDHPEQARLGMRGIIADRNYKFLLLVDGHLMNQKAHSGVVSEIQNWDLSDVKQVEIIRGPGSVTYGPGAVAGVIAITTKSAEDAPGLAVSTSQVVPYSSQAGTVQYGKIGNGWSLYSYVNATWTRGYDNPKGYLENGSADYKVYSWGRAGTSAHTNAGRKYANNDLLADYDRDVPYMPQMRAHVNANLPMGFSSFARYTQGGTTTGAALSKIMSPDSEQVDSRTFLYRQAVASLKHQIQFTPEFALSSKVEAGSQDYERYSGTVGDRKSLTSPINTTHNFAESDITAQTLLNTSFLEKYQVALGAEYVYSKVGTGWFDDDRALKFGDAQNIVNGPDSWVGQSDTTRGLGSGLVWVVPYSKASSKSGVFVDDGISSHTVSFMGEANLAFHDQATLLVSGRADKNTWSAWMVSPRIAVVSAITPSNIVKVIWQKSMRMSTLEQMYLESEIMGEESDPEVLEGVELIYTSLPTDQVTINVSGYRNNVETIGFSTTNVKTELQGEMVVYGGEASLKWKNDRWLIGINHAASLLDDFSLAENQVKSGVSYSDMRLGVKMTTKKVKTPAVPASGTTPAQAATYWTDSVVIDGYGNSLNNWVENITKATVRCKITPTVTLQADTRFFWSFEGYQDQLDALRRARPAIDTGAEGDTIFYRYVKPQIDSFVALVEAEDPYGPQLRFDLAAEWQMSKNVRLTGMVQNAFEIGENRRFDYISGLNQANPRASWVEEPRTFYVKLSSMF